MKRLLTIIAALLLSISMIFANGSQEAPSAESDDGLSGTITMIAMANQAKGLNAAFDEYQKDHPNVDLDIVVANTVTDFETMMTTYIAADELPDMYLNQVGAVQQSYAAEGYLMPITDIGVMDKIIDGDKELITWQGDYYAVPMGTTMNVIIVNNAVLKEAGINIGEDNYPKCWSDFIDLCDQLVAAGVQYPVTVAGKDSSSITAWPFQYIYQTIYGEDPNWYANMLRGEHAWNDELYLSMFDKYAEMKKYISPSALGNDVNGMYRAFISGESPILFQVANTVGAIRDIAPDLDIICLPSCFTDDPADQTIIAGLDSGLSICSTTDIPEVCISFMQYLVSDEGSTIYAENAQEIPTTRVNHAKVDPSYTLCLKILQEGQLPVSAVLSRQWIPGIKEIMKTASQNWFAGADAKVVCDEIQSQHDRLVAANPEWVQNFLDTYIEK